MQPIHNNRPTRHLTICVCAVLVAAWTLLLPGCASVPKQREAKPLLSMGAVAPQPRQLAELLIEGHGTNNDGVVKLQGRMLRLTGQATRDLLAIAEEARLQRDWDTQYAALYLTAISEDQRQSAARWNSYALMFRDLPNYAAAALSDTVDQDIALAEQANGGLSAESSTVHMARRARASQEYRMASVEYEAAQGYFDDDESRIELARIQAHAAGKLGRGDLGPEFELQVQQLLAKTRSDLWESQADRADSIFAGNYRECRNRLEAAKRRADDALTVYEQGQRPLPCGSGEH
jgi:hypothetical protein